MCALLFVMNTYILNVIFVNLSKERDSIDTHNFRFRAMQGKKSHQLSKMNNQFSLDLLDHAVDKPTKMLSSDVPISCRL